VLGFGRKNRIEGALPFPQNGITVGSIPAMVRIIRKGCSSVVKPFRFGVFGESVRTRDALVGTARRAEAAGYATFLLRDHFQEEPFGHQLAPMASLATVAAVTETLRIGTLVFANDYRPR